MIRGLEQHPVCFLTFSRTGTSSEPTLLPRVFHPLPILPECPGMAGKAKARCVVNIALIIDNDRTLRQQKNSTLIVRLLSTAQTGFFYTTQRLRTGPKLAAVKYDPRGKLLDACSLGSHLALTSLARTRVYVRGLMLIVSCCFHSEAKSAIRRE